MNILLIKEIAEEKKISFEELALRIGKTKSTIYNYINGTTKIDVDTIEKIAEVLGKPVGYFFGEGSGNYQNNRGSKNQNLQGNVNGNVTINNGHKLTDIEKDAEIIKLNERLDLLIEKIGDREKQLEDKQKLLDKVIEGKDKQIARIIEEKEKQLKIREEEIIRILEEKEKQILLLNRMIEMLEKQIK